MIRQTYIKNGVIRTFLTDTERVFATLLINGVWISNPTLEVFIGDGWEVYVPPTPEPYVPTLEELVEGKLRERYSINQEFEVQRKRDTEPEAFAVYYAYVEDCISWANEQSHR